LTPHNLRRSPQTDAAEPSAVSARGRRPGSAPTAARGQAQSATRAGSTTGRGPSAGATGQAASATAWLREVEAVAGIGSYSNDFLTGEWVSSEGLDALFGIDADFPRTVEGWLSLIHPADREAMAAYFIGEVVGKGHPFDRRYRIVRPTTGEERWVHGRGGLDGDATGRPVRMFGTISDITEQVHAELERERLDDALRRSERNLAEAQRIAHIGSWEWDLVSGNALRSDELHRIYGVEPGRIPSSPDAFLAFIHPGDRALVQAAEQEAVQGTDGYVLDYRGLRPDGSIRQIHDEGRVVRDEHGTAVRVVGTVQDVTDLILAAEERTRLAAVVEHTTDAVVVCDLNGAIEYVNPAFERMSGYAGADVVGQNPRILRSGRQSHAFYRSMWQRLTGGSGWSGRFFNRRADGVLYEVEATIAPIRGADGAMNGYVGVERDITALQAARSSLASEFRERAQVAAGLSRLQPAATAEETAAEICDELIGVPGVDMAAIITLLAPGQAVPLAVRGPGGLPLSLGRPLPASRAAYLLERAQRGPWAEAWQPRPADGDYGRRLGDLGITAMAYAPIRNGEGLLGLVKAGTRDPQYARHMIDHLPAVGEFAATASALLSQQLEGSRRISQRRARLDVVVARHAFHSVFQPIVDLTTGAVVAYEALTRFSDDVPPDRRFAEAWAVDRGVELELATLVAALDAANQLPPGRWLEVNMSPRLLAETPRLRAALAHLVDRPLVIEITEHESVADYRALGESIEALGDVQTAVDDAGAGIANFAHIVELRPHFVKLDISLVRGVQEDIGRQALVLAMRHFAQTTGCRLIAEGVETQEEAAAIEALGVEFGQGFWYGRPEVVMLPAPRTTGAPHRPARPELEPLDQLGLVGGPRRAGCSRSTGASRRR
jgi:PAS domain S-box-containing protein